MDNISGDLICTQCGVVLEDHLRDPSAEWRDFSSNNNEDIAKGLNKARCGGREALVDESKWVGGLMPTKMSSTPYYGRMGTGANSQTEEKYNMAMVRSRLKRTHNMIENMVEQEQKAKYRDAVLDRKARDAKLGRGEIEDSNEGGINVDGDYEGLMSQREESVRPLSAKSSSFGNQDDEHAFVSLKDKKWSLTDAILLYGTLNQVQLWSASTPTADGGEWTQTTLETERAIHTKKCDATTRSSLQKLYTAFTILEKAAEKLDLNSPSNSTFREAVSWLLKFVTKTDGIRIKGISSGSSSLSGVNDKESTLLLSLGIKPLSTAASQKLVTELHRVKQYASLGSAILYLSAKRTGVGRSLIEVCSAFGTYQVMNKANNTSPGDAEVLVRPKYCSKAMQELRTVLPEIAVLTGEGGAIATTQELTVKLPSSSPFKSEEGQTSDETPVKVTPTYNIMSSSSTETSLSGPIKSECTTTAIPATTGVMNTEEKALADLISRMAHTINLPPSAIAAAASVAIQCLRDTRAASKQTKVKSSGEHIRPRQRSRLNNVAPHQSKDTPENIAIASILLVCTAGATMQRLAGQALSNARSDAASSLSSSLDNVSPILSISSDLTSKTAVAATSAKVKSEPSNNTITQTLPSWAEWHSQPTWHRNISQLEQSSGAPRKTIISYYSTVIYPRRFYFLGVVASNKKNANEGTEIYQDLLHDIVAAAPLMSLRNL